jgi:hypothetical protein
MNLHANPPFDFKLQRPKHQLDSYFFSMNRLQPLQHLSHHLYSPSSAHVSNLNSNQRNYLWFFISEHLRRELLEKNEARRNVLDPNGLLKLIQDRKLIPCHKRFMYIILCTHLGSLVREIRESLDCLLHFINPYDQSMGNVIVYLGWRIIESETIKVLVR